eukprot:m.51706 g.51706  ORF g.51706 m.51706 type:complete len:81 (+) comp48339_c0_seq5:539-781(+)
MSSALRAVSSAMTHRSRLSSTSPLSSDNTFQALDESQAGSGNHDQFRERLACDCAVFRSVQYSTCAPAYNSDGSDGVRLG